jgi:hypothetical protein
MINEINHREPRGINEAGIVAPISVLKSKSGWHSESKARRKSNLEVLGPGVNLYLKMVKYLGCLFFLFAILSIPCYMLYFNSLKNQQLELSESYLSYSETTQLDLLRIQLRKHSL